MKTIYVALVLIISTVSLSLAQDIMVRVDGTTNSPITIISINKSYLIYRYGDNPNEKREYLNRVAYVIKGNKRFDYNPLKSGVTVANSTPVASLVGPSSQTQTVVSQQIPLNNQAVQTTPDQPQNVPQSPPSSQPVNNQTDNVSYAPVTRYSTETNSTGAYEREMQGRNDARVYYRNYRSPAGWTLASTLIFSPVGLITAIGTSVTPPSNNNLEYPNATLMRDPAYAKGYTAQAHRKKSGKVWGNFGIGLLVNVVVGVLVLGSQR